VLHSGAKQLVEEDLLLEEDFNVCYEYKISRSGNQKRFDVKDYAPPYFYQIRKHFNLSNEDFLNSWTNPDFQQTKTTGKSSSIFVYSFDKKYIIKTITQSESKFLREIFPSYFEHIQENDNSLMMRFYGHHCIRKANKRLYFIVLNNVLATDKSMTEIYDLKGSKIGRAVTEKEREKKHRSYCTKRFGFLS